MSAASVLRGSLRQDLPWHRAPPAADACRRALPAPQGEDAAEQIFGLLDVLQRALMDVSESTQLVPKSTRRNTFELLFSNGVQGVKRLRKTISTRTVSSAGSSSSLKTGGPPLHRRTGPGWRPGPRRWVARSMSQPALPCWCR
jgi:hypothetical protein